MLRDLRTIIFVFLCIISQFFIIIPTSSNSISIKESIKHQNIKLGLNPSNIIEMIQKVDESKLRTYVQTIQDFGPHPTGSEALYSVGEYIYNELTFSKLPVDYLDWNNKNYTGKNIVATLQGIGKTDGVIILCAHYDTIKISPGAEDDGSGVAILLMLAKIMSDNSFNTTIKFILFSGEEQGMLGSRFYVKNSKENILGVLALDKVGYAVTPEDGKKIVHHSNVESDWMIDISTKMAEEYSDIIQLEVLRWSEDLSSDHVAFTEEGFCGTEFVRYAVNPFYHTSEDKIEHMNITYLAKVCKLTVATISTIADLNTILKNDDIKIIIKGTYLSEISQIYIKIENKGYEIDTANVTINISLIHIFRNDYVSTIEKYYKIPCNWNLTKEIEEYWEFLVAGHTFTRGLFRLNVEIQGINDDAYLYKKEITYGFIINRFIIILIPKL
jgi:hypothetical protein